MSDDFADWVAAMLDGTQTPKPGAIVMLDYAMKVKSRLEWSSGLITEVGFPAADASNKGAARVRVTIQPESTHLVAGSGVVYPVTAPHKAQKVASASNFRFALSGLEAAGHKVVSVSAVTVTRRAGDGALVVADIAFRVPESDVAPYATWFDDAVIEGQGTDSGERTGTLAFRAANLSDLMRVDLEGVGIVRLSRERQQDGIEVAPMVKVDLYCEAVRLGAVAPPPLPTVAPPAAPPPRSAVNESADTAGSVISLLEAVTRTLRESSRPAEAMSLDAIAERLLAPGEPTQPGDDFDRGRAAGRAWASGHARLDELEAVSALDERDDWVSLAIGDGHGGHSLLPFLAERGEVGAVGSGPVDLERDEFTTGLVAGAADVHRDVAPRLRDRPRPGG
jgi:hypothetical protein